MKLVIPVLATMFLSACAAYNGRGLVPGDAGLAEVVQVMGEPAMRWRGDDGSVQLAYPRGPLGFHTFMVRIGPGGKLEGIENVLDTEGFAQIRAGMSEAEVLQTLGPPIAARTAYFQARDERVWQWRHCDPWNTAGHFTVLFDGRSRKVRTTMSIPESCAKAFCSCSR